jgi:hypothetical protein
MGLLMSASAARYTHRRATTFFPQGVSGLTLNSICSVNDVPQGHQIPHGLHAKWIERAAKKLDRGGDHKLRVSALQVSLPAEPAKLEIYFREFLEQQQDEHFLGHTLSPILYTDPILYTESTHSSSLKSPVPEDVHGESR